MLLRLPATLVSAFLLVLVKQVASISPPHLEENERACRGAPFDSSRLEKVTESSFKAKASKDRKYRVFDSFQVQVAPSGAVAKGGCAQRLRLQETHSDVPIYGAEVLLTVPGCGTAVEKRSDFGKAAFSKAVGKSATRVSVPEGYTPAFGKEHVVPYLQEKYNFHIPVGDNSPDPILYVFPSQPKDYLVYSTRLLVPKSEINAQETRLLHVLVDAHKLQVISECILSSSDKKSKRRKRRNLQQDISHYCDDCGSKASVPYIMDDVTLQPIHSLYLNDTNKQALVQEAILSDGSSVYVPAAVDDIYWEGTYDCEHSSSYSCNHRNELATSCADAMSDTQYVAVATLEFTRDELGVLGGLGMSESYPQPVKGNVHYGYYECNAFYYENEVIFGDCDCDYWTPMTTIDVVAHEIAHGLTHYTSGLNYYGESGGLNEGFSDILGTIMEFVINDSQDTPDFYIGEAMEGSHGILRYMDDPTLDGLSIGSVCDFYDYMTVHYSSGVPRKAYAKAARACEAHSCSTSLSECAILMGKLFFYVNLNELTSYSTFLDAAEQTCSAVEDFFAQLDPLTSCTEEEVKSFAIEGWSQVDVLIEEDTCEALKLCPTDAPTLSPTMGPTVDYLDGCLDATLLSVPSRTDGTTDGSPNYDIDTCSFSSVRAPGRWYHIVGDGSPIQVSLECGSDYYSYFVIDVWTGSCASLGCIGYDGNYCGYTSSVTFQTSVGQDYYIFVYDYYGYGQDFELAISEATLAPTFAPTSPPLSSEDGCSQAVSLSLPSTTYGDLSEAETYAIDGCGSGYARTFPARWYSVTGTGSSITASICGSTTSFDTLLSVWSGATCSQLRCVGGNDDYCGTRSSVTWESQAREEYYVAVYPYSFSSGTEYEYVLSLSHEFDGATGDFNLSVNDDTTRIKRFGPDFFVPKSLQKTKINSKLMFTFAHGSATSSSRPSEQDIDELIEECTVVFYKNQFKGRDAFGGLHIRNVGHEYDASADEPLVLTFETEVLWDQAKKGGSPSPTARETAGVMASAPYKKYINCVRTISSLAKTFRVRFEGRARGGQ